MWGLSSHRPVLFENQQPRHWPGVKARRPGGDGILSVCAPHALRCGETPIESNVVDRGALEDRLRSLPDIQAALLFGHTVLSGLPRRVTLVLPDIAVRSTVLQLEQVPARREEQEALVRWRLGQEQHLPLTGTKLHRQIFPSQHPKAAVHMVLVIAIQESILAEYEGACEQRDFFRKK